MDEWRKGKGELNGFPNAFLPLYRQEVKRATGLSAAKLRQTIEAKPEQYGPGIVQTHLDGEKIHYRFNPHLHTEFLKEKQKWHAIGQYQEILGERVRGVSPGATAQATQPAPCASKLSRPMVSQSIKPRPGPKPKLKQQECTLTGADLLAQILAETPAE